MRLCRAGSTVLVVSHEEELLRRLAGEIWWLSEGRLAGRGDPSEILLPDSRAREGFLHDLYDQPLVRARGKLRHDPPVPGVDELRRDHVRGDTAADEEGRRGFIARGLNAEHGYVFARDAHFLIVRKSGLNFNTVLRTTVFFTILMASILMIGRQYGKGV